MSARPTATHLLLEESPPRVDVEVDGKLQERPQTQWSRSG
jgi:hypothetical protein